jgi:hypothetical protein
VENENASGVVHRDKFAICLLAPGDICPLFETNQDNLAGIPAISVGLCLAVPVDNLFRPCGHSVCEGREMGAIGSILYARRTRIFSGTSSSVHSIDDKECVGGLNK